MRGLYEVCLDRGICQSFADVKVEARSDGRRCSCRDEHAEPLVEHEPVEAAARFALERFARDVSTGDELPFGDPYDWAPYFVLGRSEITIEERVT